MSGAAQRATPAAEKFPYLKITRPDTHGEKFVCWMPVEHFSASDEFDGALAGDRIVLEFCEVTQAEIDVLPEFEGW